MPGRTGHAGVNHCRGHQELAVAKRNRAPDASSHRILVSGIPRYKRQEGLDSSREDGLVEPRAHAPKASLSPSTGSASGSL